MSRVRLSPGRLTALWLVLQSLAKLGEVARRDDVLAIASRSALRSGGLPVHDGLRLATDGGFVTGDDDVRLTALGHDVLSRNSEDEPNTEVLRIFASALVLRNPPLWVSYWQGDPSALPMILSDAEQRVLLSADLANVPLTTDLDAWAWWNALRAVPPDIEMAALRKAIGDAAEELSLRYERRRLEGEGFPELARRVRWVARESPAYGFDILSFAGTTHDASAPSAGLAVEVKGSASASTGSFQLFLTVHEYETSRSLGKNYVLHLWDRVRPDDVEPKPHSPLAIVHMADVGHHLPSSPECSGRCNWHSARVELLIDEKGPASVDTQNRPLMDT